MKHRFTLTFCYFLYVAMAVFLHPVKSVQAAEIQDQYKASSCKQDKPVAMENTVILHGDLLFRF